LNRFVVASPGLLTTFQDLGREAMLKYAISAAGAMDQTAVRLVNLLLGNCEDAAVLETTMTGLKLRALADGWIAVGGADLGLMVNGRQAPMWTVLKIREGDVIAFHEMRSGIRAYLGVPGGFDAPLMLGSRSVYLRGGLGRALKRGDEITALLDGRRMVKADRTLPVRFVPEHDMRIPFRVLPGPQLDYFSARGIEVFSTAAYTVSPVSDRQGIRTRGPSIERVKGPDIITDPTPMGAIQVPGSGVPIILHRDAQVTGGYAKIAILCRTELDRAGQLGPGDKVRFEVVSRSTALDRLKVWHHRMAEARRVLSP